MKKSFDAPEETRSLHKGKIEAVDLGGVEIRRVTHEPGGRWSECVKPTVGTDSCQVGHLGELTLLPEMKKPVGDLVVGSSFVQTSAWSRPLGLLNCL
jgi:hypothetical protein